MEAVQDYIKAVVEGKDKDGTSSNHLIFTQGRSDFKSTWAGNVVSSYACRLLALHTHKNVNQLWNEVIEIYEKNLEYPNKATCGWMLEGAVKKHILAGQGKLDYYIPAKDKELPTTLSAPSVRTFEEPKSLLVTEQLDDLWFFPKKFNQGGYDAAHIRFSAGSDQMPECVVTFINVTLAHQHSLKWCYMVDFLAHLCSEPDLDDPAYQLLDLGSEDPALLASFFPVGPDAEYMWPMDATDAKCTLTEDEKKGTARTRRKAITKRCCDIAKQRRLDTEKKLKPAVHAMPAGGGKRPALDDDDDEMAQLATSISQLALYQPAVRWPLLSARNVFGKRVSALRVQLVFLCPDRVSALKFKPNQADRSDVGLFGVCAAFLC
jgi:hypothetical protein